MESHSNKTFVDFSGLQNGGGAMHGNGIVQAQVAEGVDEMRYSGTELVMLYDYKVSA